MRTVVVVLFWLFVASVSVKAHRVDKRRGRRTSQRIADGLQMLSHVMEQASHHMVSSATTATNAATLTNQNLQ